MALPGALELGQAAFQRLHVGLGAVAVGEGGLALAAAVTPAAQQLPGRAAGDVAQGSRHETLPQVWGEHRLQPCGQEGAPGGVRAPGTPSLDPIPTRVPRATPLGAHIHSEWSRLSGLSIDRGSSWQRSSGPFLASFDLFLVFFFFLKQQPDPAPCTPPCPPASIPRWHSRRPRGTGPTLQLHLVLRALHQHRAHRVQVVVVAAAERPRPCLCHLGGTRGC